MHGGTGGSDHNMTCPREQFLLGWDISADSRVNRIHPLCSRAEE